MGEPSLVHLVHGSDPVLRADVTSRLIEQLLAGDDRSFALDDLEIPASKSDDGDDFGARSESSSAEDDSAGAGIDFGVVERVMVALGSPPFLTNRRVVVIRNYGSLSKSQCELIVERLSDPTPGVFVVFERHKASKAKSPIDKFCESVGAKAIKPEAETVSEGSKSTSVVEVELQRCLIATGVKLHSDTRSRICAHLGDDAGRVSELVDVLASRFPIGTTVRADEIDPYLGALGAIDKPFELTTAIENGDTPKALEVLHRLMHATSAKSKNNKGVHPMQLMGTLTGYYRVLLKLDDPNINNKDDAVRALGGNPWAAKYRLDALGRIGQAGLKDAFGYLAEADLDLRGRRAIDEETVMQVLIARLCALSNRGARSRSAAQRR